MTKLLHRIVIPAVAASCVAAVVVAVRLRPGGSGRRPVATIIRHPTAALPVLPDLPPPPVPINIAPFATVSVSSMEENGPSGEGVADGRVDANEWVTRGERSGAWIKLEWQRPVTVVEIELYDRPSPEENVTGGTLMFDDGSMIAVPPLPPGGSPYRIGFPPRLTRSVVFRIDNMQGRSAGLAEIMVFGVINPN